MPDSPPHELLAFLMDQHSLSQSDLEREGIAQQALLSAILSGKRSVSKGLAKTLGERFKVSPALFL